MARGKVIFSNDIDVEKSTFVTIVDLSKIESVAFTGDRLVLVPHSGQKIILDNFTVSELAEVSEFVAAYARAREDQAIYKQIVLTNI